VIWFYKTVTSPHTISRVEIDGVVIVNESCWNCIELIKLIGLGSIGLVPDFSESYKIVIKGKAYLFGGRD
jgi:hypothetical protein